MIWNFVSANHKVMDTFLSGGFHFAGTDKILTFKVLLLSFLCYLIHLNPFFKQYGAWAKEYPSTFFILKYTDLPSLSVSDELNGEYWQLVMVW